MARLKQTISERRYAAIDAARILRARGDDAGATQLEAEGEKLSNQDEK